MQKYYTIFTNTGLAKVANAQITNNKLEITHLAFGDAQGELYNPTGDETTLRNEVWRTTASVELSTENPNWFEVVAVIPAGVGGFTVREVGLYDVDGDLVGIGNYPETPKPVIAEGSIMDLIVRAVVASSNIETIDMALDPTIATVSRNFVMEQIVGVNEQLAQIRAEDAISPEMFEGTDREKLQQALDYALNNKVSVKLAKMYDLTGATPVILNKNGSADRTAIYIYGVGGGVRKRDNGIIWTGKVSNVGDLFFVDIKYESVSGAGTIVYDFDKLIRIYSMGCSYRNVDKIGYVGDEREYWQSVRFSQNNIVGGRGAAFSYIGAYDTTFEGNLIEHRESVIEQRVKTESLHRANYNVRIINNVMEGLTGFAIKLRESNSLLIEGNYFELNVGGHIIFTDKPLLLSVNISNNRSFGGNLNGQLDNNPLIIWSGETRNCTSSNNIAQNAPVHNLADVNVNRYVQSNNDRSSYENILGGNLNALIVTTTDRTKMYETSDNLSTTHLGLFKRYTKTVTNTTLLANQKLRLEVDFGIPIYSDDMIDVQAFVINNAFINVLYTQRQNNSVIVYLQNLESNDVTISVMRVNVLKAHITIHG